jgi:hypothetical protein
VPASTFSYATVIVLVLETPVFKIYFKKPEVGILEYKPAVLRMVAIWFILFTGPQPDVSKLVGDNGINKNAEGHLALETPTACSFKFHIPDAFIPDVSISLAVISLLLNLGIKKFPHSCR